MDDNQIDPDELLREFRAAIQRVRDKTVESLTEDTEISATDSPEAAKQQ